MFDALPKFFLAANSADGFISQFECFAKPYDEWYTYIVKGGPGTGKSSFMKRIAEAAIKRGESVFFSPCSSDPDSLDAVILNDRKIMVFDGTAPHAADPLYPGISGEIINLGEFWNGEKLKNNKKKIIEISEKNKVFHKRASLCIAAAGRVKRDNMKISLLAADIEKIVDYAEKTAHKYITPTNKKGGETICFLQGVTPEGDIFYQNTIEYFCKKIIIVNDQKGTVSNVFMSIVRDIAISLGHKIFTVKNNVLPGEKIDHILIPEISVAFCSESGNTLFSDKSRRIRSERFEDENVIYKSNKRIKFNIKLEREFTRQAIEALNKAKMLHDELESYYISAMNFDLANAYADSFIKKIFN